MAALRVSFLTLLLLITFTAAAQINIYLGGNLQGNYAWMQGDETTFNPGMGGGFNFVYWEHEYWFLKAGLDYGRMTSSRLDYPDDYDVVIADPEDKSQITFTEQSLGIPITFYYRPFESGANTLLVTGTVKTMFVVHLKENTETLGALNLTGAEINSRTKSSIGVGVGYQRQLDRYLYLNIIPSINMDVRAARSYRYFTLTAEMIFGVY